MRRARACVSGEERVVAAFMCMHQKVVLPRLRDPVMQLSAQDPQPPFQPAD
jgi:hypothetical protein